MRRGPNSKQRSGLCSRDKEGVWFLTQPSRRGGGRHFTARAEQDAKLECWYACSSLARKIPLKKSNEASFHCVNAQLSNSQTWHFLTEPALESKQVSSICLRSDTRLCKLCEEQDLSKHHTCTKQTVIADRNHSFFKSFPALESPASCLRSVSRRSGSRGRGLRCSSRPSALSKRLISSHTHSSWGARVKFTSSVEN